MRYIGPEGDEWADRKAFEEFRAIVLSNMGAWKIKTYTRTEAERAVLLCWGNKGLAAKLLGIGRTSLWRTLNSTKR